MAVVKRSRFPGDDKSYERLGIKRDIVEPWEDGLRTKGRPEEYEWWYFDSTYPDGTKLVIVFYAKNPVKVGANTPPFVTMELSYNDGRKYYDQLVADPGDYYFSKDQCRIQIGSSSVDGDLHNYNIHFEGSRMTADLSLTNTIGPWRPQCGQLLFGDNDEYEFNWLPSVPEGEVTADVTFPSDSIYPKGYPYPEAELHLKGTGYHDHNWGNTSMLKLMHHWYWGRGKIGDYKVISAWITAEKKYGFNEFDIFMLAKGNKILGDNRNHTLKFLPEEKYIDSVTGKPVYGKIIYEYETPDGENYRVTFDRKNDISTEFFYESLPRFVRPIARFLNFNGSYQRFEGTASLERIVNGTSVETSIEESAVWELMYFGDAGENK